MAFDKANFAMMSGGLVQGTAPKMFGYVSSVDTLATIKATGYFNDYVDILDIHDLIYLHGTDTEDVVKIVDLTPDVIVITIGTGGGVPTHYIYASGVHTTVGGGLTEFVPVTGVVSTDIVFTQLATVGASPTNIVSAQTGTGQFGITFGADPLTDHLVSWQVIRNVT